MCMEEVQSNHIKSLNDLIELINKNNGFKFRVKVVAGSKVNSIEFLDDYIKIKIAQKPVEGKANKAIIEYLSKMLSFAKSRIEITNGEKSSIKTIKIS